MGSILSYVGIVDRNLEVGYSNAIHKGHPPVRRTDTTKHVVEDSLYARERAHGLDFGQVVKPRSSTLPVIRHSMQLSDLQTPLLEEA